LWDKISNEEFWQRTKRTPVEQQLKERKWRWIGHPLRQPQGALERHAMDWNPQGTRKMGRSRTTRKRIRGWELQTSGSNWKGAKGLAWDRTKWKTRPRVPRTDKMGERM
jgi:hypothetical protein